MGFIMAWDIAASWDMLEALLVAALLELLEPELEVCEP
jgi:hypothetical protein